MSLLVASGIISEIVLSPVAEAQEVGGATEPSINLPSGSGTGFEGSRSSVLRGSGGLALPAPVTKIKVRADDPFVRSTFLDAAETMRSEFSRVLGIEYSEWQIPIEINVVGDAKDIVKGRDIAREVSITAGTISLRLYVKLHESFRGRDFEREMLRILLQHEMLLPYREFPDRIPERVKIPDWLLTGMYEHLQFLRNRNRSEIFLGILEGGDMMKVDDILRIENPAELDPMTRAVFEASSAALIKTLIDLEDGIELSDGEENGGGEGKPGKPLTPEEAVLEQVRRTHVHFRGMIRSLMTMESELTGDPATPLKEHFPELRENSMSLNKWWTLQIASLAEKTAFDYHGIEETKLLIDELGRVVFSADKGPVPDKAEAGKRGVLNKWLGKLVRKEGEVRQEDEVFEVEKFRDFMKREDLAEALKRNRFLIKEVELRGFPAYSAVATQFDLIFTRIEAQNTLGISKEIEAARSLKAEIDAILERATDYMNYYEATQAPTRGGAFDDYREMRRRLEISPPPPRDDKITRHLDQIEREFD